MHGQRFLTTIAICSLLCTPVAVALDRQTFYTITSAQAAESSDILAKQIQKNLRAAERDMFNGKNEKADKLLVEIGVSLKALQEQDPQHKQLSSLTSKYERTRKTVDKKLGRSTKTASAQALPPKPKVKEMPRTQQAPPASAMERKKAMLAAKNEKAAGNPEVQGDIETIASMYNQAYPQIESMAGRNIAFWTTGDGIAESRKALEQITEAQIVIDQISNDVARLAEKYNGINRDNPSQLSSDIYNSIRSQLGSNPKGSPGNQLAALLLAIQNINATRAATGDHIARSAEQVMAAWADQMTDAQLERLRKGKELIAVAAQIDPTSSKITELLADMDERIVQFGDKMATTIDQNSWQGDISSFNGPGTIKNLKNSVKQYLQADRDWGGKKGKGVTIVAVAVRGPWKIAERDLFGRVIRWRLPVHAAVTDNALRPRNIARVYDLSIVALLGAATQAPQAPPWDGFWVGDSYMMRLDKL